MECTLTCHQIKMWPLQEENGETACKRFALTPSVPQRVWLLDEIERPVIEAADALVRVECASVNPLDLKMLTCVVRERFPLSFPYVVGIDLSGVIVEVGTLVKTLSVGDRVMGRLEPGLGQGSDFSRVGAFAEYVSVPAKHLALALAVFRLAIAQAFQPLQVQLGKPLWKRAGFEVIRRC
jgi:NADPH:quinone reductase-like Zn-dependent oxidoreductase